jgi:hypothetical protein
MFKGFSKRQNFNAFSSKGKIGATNYSAYDKGGCVLWMDASSGHHLIPDTAINVWYDKIAGVPFTQNTGANQPIYRSSIASLNNLPAIQFDGNDALTSTTRSFGAPNNPLSGAYFAVVQVITQNQVNAIFLQDSNGDTAYLGLQAIQTNIRGIGVYSGGSSLIDSGIRDFNAHIIAWKPGASGTGGVWVDGVKYAGTWTNQLNYRNIGVVLGSVTINGYLGEFLVYHSLFSDNDIEDVCNDLNAKYAIY